MGDSGGRLVFKTLSSRLARDRAGINTGWLGGRPCLQSLVLIITLLGYVCDKPCWQPVADNTLSLTVTPLTRFPKECFLLDCPGLGLS